MIRMHVIFTNLHLVLGTNTTVASPSARYHDCSEIKSDPASRVVSECHSLLIGSEQYDQVCMTLANFSYAQLYP